MAILYIDKVHGAPELDLKLEINDKTVKATLYSANDYGGWFKYPDGLEYKISAGGVGFTFNTGEFVYSKSGVVVKTASGKIGNGTLEVRSKCYGAGGCFKSSQSGKPSYNSSKSSDIDTTKLTVYSIASSYVSTILNDTLICSYVMSVPPSNLSLDRTYLETPMSINYTIGSGTFNKIIYGIKVSETANPIFTEQTTNTLIVLNDTQLLNAYKGFQNSGIQFPNRKVYVYVEVQTESGNISGNFDVLVGGTAWVKNDNNTWIRAVPYKPNSNKPCIMYTKVNNEWKRGYP